MSAHSERLNCITAPVPAGGFSGRDEGPGCPRSPRSLRYSRPLEMATVAGLWRSTSTFRSDTVRLDGSTTQTAGRRSDSVSADAGISMVGALSSLHASDDGRAEPHGRGRIGEADLDLERPGDRIGLRRDLPDPPDGRHRRIVRQAHRDERHRAAPPATPARARRTPHPARPSGRRERSIVRPGPLRRARRRCAITMPPASAFSSVSPT